MNKQMVIKDLLEQVPPRWLAELLAREHPQVAAALLAMLSEARRAAVVALMPPAARDEGLARLARPIELVSPIALDAIEGLLHASSPPSRRKGRQLNEPIQALVAQE